MLCVYGKDTTVTAGASCLSVLIVLKMEWDLMLALYARTVQAEGEV